MGAKVSEEMKRARQLVESGMSAYAAAKAAGITQSAISKSAWYRKFKAEKRETTK